MDETSETLSCASDDPVKQAVFRSFKRTFEKTNCGTNLDPNTWYDDQSALPDDYLSLGALLWMMVCDLGEFAGIDEALEHLRELLSREHCPLKTFIKSTVTSERLLLVDANSVPGAIPAYQMWMGGQFDDIESKAALHQSSPWEWETVSFNVLDLHQHANLSQSLETLFEAPRKQKLSDVSPLNYELMGISAKRADAEKSVFQLTEAITTLADGRCISGDEIADELLGLDSGVFYPRNPDHDAVFSLIREMAASKKITLSGKRSIGFSWTEENGIAPIPWTQDPMQIPSFEDIRSHYFAEELKYRLEFSQVRSPTKEDYSGVYLSNEDFAKVRQYWTKKTDSYRHRACKILSPFLSKLPDGHMATRKHLVDILAELSPLNSSKADYGWTERYMKNVIELLRKNGLAPKITGGENKKNISVQMKTEVDIAVKEYILQTQKAKTS